MAHFLKNTIILPVKEIYDTIDWYSRVLGFQTRYIHGSGRRGEEKNHANYAILYRDSVEVHFIMDESTPAHPATGWQVPGNGYLGLSATNVDEVYEAILEAGATTDGPVRKMNWPAKGFNLKDPDGNYIHIEQPDPT